MKIATFINEHGETADFSDKGAVCLYEQTGGNWVKKKELFLELTMDMGLDALRRNLRKVVSQLDGCEIFLVKKLNGVLHILLEEMKFRTWISEGTIREQLDNVAKKERDLAAQIKRDSYDTHEQSCNKAAGCGNSSRCGGSRNLSCDGLPKHDGLPPLSSVAVNKGDGYYRINLAEVLKTNPGMNSREALIPFMQGNTYRKLEIIADHQPRWFSRMVNLLNLNVESEEPIALGHQIKIVISRTK